MLELLLTRPAYHSLAEIAERTGLHQNTVRSQVEALVDRGLVDRRRRRTAHRGQPAWEYLASGPTPAPANELTELAVTLARALRSSAQDPVGDAESAGKAWGRSVAGTLECPADEAVPAALHRLGFAPRRRGQTLRLTRCPLLKAALAEPEIVCGVHRGLVRGVAGSDEVDLRPFAEAGACLVEQPGRADS